MSSFYNWLFEKSAVIAMDDGRKVYRYHADGSPCYAEKEEDCPIISHGKKAEEADDVGPSDSGETKEEKPSFITQEEDSAYLDLIKRGDYDTALKMIRDVASRAMPNTKIVGEDGLPKVVYHATNQQFTAFSTPSYFAETREATEGIKGFSQSSRVIPVFLNIEEPYSIDAEGGMWNRIFVPGDGYRSLNVIVNMERQNGWKEYRKDDTVADVDGIIVSNVREGDSGAYLTTDYIPKKPSQIKAAGITYDDKGDAIPLSRRFDMSNPDFRY